jgi:hypothetical protein
VAVGLAGILGSPGRLQAQAVGFEPRVGSASDGVGLSATPAVSADRRYVRLSLDLGFQTVNGFQNFPVPAAVAGGGNRGGGLGVVSGMNGPLGTGVPGGPAGLSDSGQTRWGYADSGFGGDPGEDLGAWHPPIRRHPTARSRAGRARKAAPDPIVAPISKKP